MTKSKIELEHVMERLEAMERKLDLLMLHVTGLLEKLERGENYPLRNMPEPPDVNDEIHIPGLG